MDFFLFNVSEVFKKEAKNIKLLDLLSIPHSSQKSNQFYIPASNIKDNGKILCVQYKGGERRGNCGAEN